MAGAITNGPGRNGVSKAKPKKGGSLVFGVDAEESGFDPTQARFDEVGVMYARTVFDPLTIVTASGGWKPYLAQSVTANARSSRRGPSPCVPTWSSTTARRATAPPC